MAVGFSMGSYIVLAAAEKYPDLFSKVVLIGTKGGGSSSTQAIAAGGTDSSGESAVMKSVFAPQDTPGQISAFAKSIASPVQLTDVQRAAVYRSLEDFDNLKNASRAKMPVLVLTGQYDGVNPPAKGASVAAALPNGTFYVVPGAGHITFFENFDYTVERIDEFLQQ